MITIKRGLPEHHRTAAAKIYWDAFQDKLRLPLGSAELATAYLGRAMNLNRAVVAVDTNDKLLGVAGFDTGNGGFIRGDTQFVYDVYGWSSWWRLMVLGMFERSVAKDAMILDGIAVDTNSRGQGIGRKLLTELDSVAQDHGLHEIWLDVIATNPRAKALYLRHGFQTQSQEATGIFRWMLNFDASERMIKTLAPIAPPSAP